ncbi:hypothetical protein VAZ01S_105_00040 [Vibrio azureus NBRC 104587]|uniref:Transposase n=1 Tax=Vibrio azureus NBRC 104587 TaxID=1219077 RepID=U3ADH1_9VIBR|nr:hypothetical protein VAZ01S_105_00040 [Vibrio azureus NBRC 104587]
MEAHYSPTGMANSKTDMRDAPDYELKPLPFEDRSCLEKNIKDATFLEQIVQFTFIEAQVCPTLGI